MADLKISELNSLAGADLVAADVVAVVDDSASETKKLTVSDLIANGVTVISDATIPSAKILFSAGAIDTAELAASAVETAKINDSAVTAAKLADNSSVTLVSTLPASGDFTGQIALDTDDDKIYIWDGSAWDSVKGAGSINVVNGSTTGEINIVASTSGDTVTISATLDDTTAAAQFLGGPTGAGGTVGYRALVGSDLPTATTTTKGGIIVNGEGLRMDLDTIEIANDVTANSSTYQAVQFNSKGLVTDARDITAADLPEATAGAIGGVKPGSGLTMGSAGAINHSNAVTGATNTKITFDAQGHVTAGTNLSASDVPDLDTAKVTTGEFPTERIADEAVTAAKLANFTVAQISETTPTADFTSQFFFNPITRDLFLWDGNVFQPVGISAGEIVLAGTYDANTNQLDSVTADGTAAGFESGSALPAAATGNNRHYVVVSQSGTGESPAPTVSLEPPDIILSNGTSYILIETSETITAQIASNVGFTATGNIASTNVQSAIAEVDNEKVAKGGDTMTGDLTLNNADVVFEGATENDFETTLTVTDPTADRTITLPDSSGTLLTTGDTGSVTSSMIADGTIVNADISASAEIAVSKLANGTARQLLQTDSAGTGVEFTSNVDVPGTFDVAGAGTFDTTLTVTGVISADGKVKFPAGTAAAPSFYSGTDTDTGLYFSAADEVSVATGGTQRVVVDSAGRVGIANTAMASLYAGGNNFVVGDGVGDEGLTIYTGNNKQGIVAFADGTTGGAQQYAGYLLYDHNSDYMALATTGSERLRIDSSGRILIGTTNAVAFGSRQVLAVTNGTTGGVLSLYNSTTATANTRISSNPTGSEINDIGIHAASTNGSIQFYTNNDTERLRIDSSGNVGIGTTAADGLLHVRGSNPNIYIETANANEQSDIIFQSHAGGDQGSVSYSLLDNSLRFATNGTSNERMRIDSSGRLLVGTTTEGEAGADNLTIADSGHCGITIRSGTTHNGAIYFSDATSGNAEFDGYIFYTQNTRALVFGTAQAEQMRIDSSGNLNFSQETASSPYPEQKLKWSNDSTTTNGFYISQNTSRQGKVWHEQGLEILFGTSDTERMRIDSSGQLLMGSSSSTFNVIANQNNAAALHLSGGGSGSANIEVHGINHATLAKTITFNTNSSERMRITSSGNVGIGKTSASRTTGGTLIVPSGTSEIIASGNNITPLIIGSSDDVTLTLVDFTAGSATPGGSITITSGTSVSYNTSSDYRLKENVVDLDGAIDRVKQLAPKRFNFIVDADKTVDGFLAHEAQTVVPEAVTGTHNEVDDEGNAVMQNIDQSKLVPLLTAALQEAIAKIETLEAKVAALEAE